MPDFGNTSVFSQTDANNNSGTQPYWSGSAAPSTLDDAGRALQGAATREWNWRNYTLTSTGSANAYVLTYSVAPAAYYNGQRFAFITNFENTGTATLNVNSVGAKTIKKDVSGVLTALSSGDIPSGAFIEVAFNTADDSFVWVNRGTTGGSLSLVSTDAGASAGPTLELYRNSASPAANDIMGRVEFNGEDSAGNKQTYGSLECRIDDPTSASEDATFLFKLNEAGATNTVMTLKGTGYIYIPSATIANPIIDLENSTSDAFAPAIRIYKSRSSGVVSSGDSVGSFQFYGHDGTNGEIAASIEAKVDGTPGNNDMPGRLVFSTTADGANSVTERLRISNTGYITTWANSQLIPGMLFKVLSADDTGSNVNTAQPWFPTNGGVSVEASTSYFFEGLLWTTRSAGTTSHTTSTLFGGTATVTSCMYAALTNSSSETASSVQARFTMVDVATAVSVKAASISATENVIIYLNGIIRINGAGTLIPQFQYSSAPGGAPTIKANSYFKLWKVGSNTVTEQGTWA